MRELLGFSLLICIVLLLLAALSPLFGLSAQGNEGPQKTFRITNFLATITWMRAGRKVVRHRWIRNRHKINWAIKNAQAFLKVQEEFGSFDAYIWGFVDGKLVQNAWQTMSELPAKTGLSEAISKDLKKRGFSFVALLQAVGLVNDRTTICLRYQELASMD